MKNRQCFLNGLFGIFLAVISGFAFILAFPPYEIWPLIFIGWLPVLVAQHRVMPAKLSSLPTAIAIGIWLEGYMGPIFNPTGSYMIYLPLVAALFALLVDIGKRKFNQKTHYRYFVIEGALSWSAIEMVRLFIPIAGTWGFIAYPLYRQVWFIQPASIFGIIGQGMLVMVVNLVLAQGIIYWLDQGTKFRIPSAIPEKMVRRWANGTALALVLWTGLSLVLLQPDKGEKVTVAAVQPDISPIITGNQGRDELLAQLFRDMIAETRQAADQGAEFIVWPEGALRTDPQVEDQLGLVNLAKEIESYLAVGYVVNLDDGTFRNEATVIDPSGEFLGVFGKDHPVLFGGETSPTRGTYPVYEKPIGTLGTIICYDLDYTDTARKLAAQGAQLIGVPSNDWGGIADKHYTHVVFRAIENRVAMVKADGGYDSVIVDPYGRIKALASYPEGGGATLVGEVLLGSGNGTINTRLGDWVGWLGIAGVVFFMFGGSFLVKVAEKKDNKGK
ncbi:MAG TPA: nitrilase-related carbon-nitrogen hydrolase [Brevefilum sp.]